MNILLFDMDGVLVDPRAYHSALQETVRLIAQALGFADFALTAEDIAEFEAARVTSEWDSSAICAALLLERLWQVDPSAALPTAPPLPRIPPHGLPAPDVSAFCAQLRAAAEPHAPARLRAERVLLEGQRARPAGHVAALTDILRNATDPYRSLTHRLFQELVLGSDAFSETYGLEAQLGSASYLATRDLPLLQGSARERLRAWLQHPERHAVIVTNRPSRSPDGARGAPEAEMGAELCGLGDAPMVALGALSWLAAQRGVGAEQFIKPSPVHTLAALRCALGDAPARALEASAELAADQRDDGGWQRLHGATVQVFEDSVKGFKSARRAQQMLAGIKVEIDVRLFGISEPAVKQRALQRDGAHVFRHISEALASVLA